MEMQQGAEAIVEIYEDYVLKTRVSKSYRIKEIDSKFIKERTRREVKVLNKCPINTPKVIETDNLTFIKMTRAPGEKLAISLEKLDWKTILKEIGLQLAKLHNAEIMHGDLTTSNIIYENKTKELTFIDFGLSFSSDKYEDKAVDLHLFKQALESKHHTIFKEAFNIFLKNYLSKVKDSKEIEERLEQVELRGRYKHK